MKGRVTVLKDKRQVWKILKHLMLLDQSLERTAGEETGAVGKVNQK